MTHTLDFQSMIMTLQDFWARKGCLIWQPYYTQVGAGTMNPATFLRVLGPEPWNVVYVEPSIRPDDARYGENPNRMQMHYQMQVILKPDPGNPQELYLESLEALGIHATEHDIRFVEDNWESPALGAWGLGWEVWLDGQEITQFTYFQQAGGVLCDPVSVEITYGLERIAIALQRVNNFRDIQWSPTLTDGDVNLQGEQEHSQYYFDVADVNRLRQMYDLYEAEADSCIQQGLVLPAHDYVLKCSHTFNVLDARGAVGVTERQALFGRMRELARRVTEIYLAQRQQLEYPFLRDEQTTTPSVISSPINTGSGTQRSTYNVQPATFLFEIGTEELPAGDLEAALTQLRERAPAWLSELRLAHGPLQVLGTPRRLVLVVHELAAVQADRQQIIKGPPASRAFDALGQPTKAAEGFARSKGLSVADLETREMDGGNYVVANIHETGRATVHVLAEALPGLIASLRFDKTMRWNRSNVAFSRPIRWLLALYGELIVPFEYASVLSGNQTRGLRFLSPSQYSVQNVDDYFAFLASQGIVLDPAQRRALVTAQLKQVASQAGGRLQDEEGLLAEVVNLVETPTAFLGAFDASHLNLPRDVLTSVMKKHQRYFPVYVNAASDRPAESDLLPAFIVVRNGANQGLELVREGNEHVIRARFADANFFVREDIKRPLEAYLPRLGTLTYQARLGSMLDKVHRITALQADMTPVLGLNEQEALVARRAAELCKADLATRMVVEMTSLQGLMGRYYALHSGEPAAVAEAIFEHYLPRALGDQSPRSLPGLAVGLADRLDTLVGLFAVGLAPSGNKDPFAQRRAALGLVQSLLDWQIDLDLRQVIQKVAAHLPVPVTPEAQAAVLDFIVERLRNVLLEQGRRYDIVDAILAVQGHNPARAATAVQELTGWVDRPDWRTILPAYARCVRITRDQKERFAVTETGFIEPSESALYQGLLVAQATPRAGGTINDCLNAFLPLIPAINRFFDEVMVMADDPAVRRNRLGLLQAIVSLAEGLADFTRLEGF